MTPMEKVRFYHVMIDSLMGERDTTRNTNASLELGFKVLAELGCSFPQSALMVGMATIRGLFKLKNAAKNDWTDQTINKLPITTDPDTASVMKTLSRFFLITYVCKPELIPLVIVKNIKMTFEKGVSIYSPPSFASLGMIISHSMGDDETGKKLASFSLRLVGRLKNTSRVAESETMLIAYSTTLHWTMFIQACRVPYLEAYQIGMRTGDTFFSVMVGALLLLAFLRSGNVSRTPRGGSFKLYEGRRRLWMYFTKGLPLPASAGGIEPPGKFPRIGSF